MHAEEVLCKFSFIHNLKKKKKKKKKKEKPLNKMRREILTFSVHLYLDISYTD